MAAQRLQIRLDLSRYCIETAVKRAHGCRLSAYLKSRGRDSTLEKEAFLLEKALVCFDFPGLRNAFESLNAGSSESIHLEETHTRIPGIRINNERINTDDFIIS